MAKRKSVSKKNKPEEDDLSDVKPDGYVGDIKPEKYWEWRTAIAEKQNATQLYENAKLVHRIKSLEAQKAQLETQLFALTKLPQSKQELEHYEREFNDTKKTIEDILGTSLKGAIINEAFQVVKPESDKDVAL